MGWVSGFAVYLVIWWVVIFMVLPWGVRPISAEDVQRGHASSAPIHPHMWLKVAVTTVIAALVWLVFYWLLDTGAISFIE